MSNWSKVIICWPVFEDEERPDFDRRVSRLRDLIEDGSYHTSAFVLAPGCGLDDDRMNFACESAVVFSCNYFCEERCVEVLKQLDWKDPDQVEVLWKDENDECYRHRFMVDDLNPINPAF